MRTLLAILLLCRPAGSSLVPLAWDASPTLDVDGYAVWTTHAGAEPEWQVTVSTLSVNLGSLPVGKYDVYVTAVLGGVHSAPSNTISIEVPEPPSGPAQQLLLEGSDDMSTWHASGNVIEVDMADPRQFYRAVWRPKPTNP